LGNFSIIASNLMFLSSTSGISPMYVAHIL
jgi:hypothetical protein